SFDQASQRWRWDIASIQARNVTANVVALMSEKLRKLPEATQAILQLAASSGNQFGLDSLTLLSKRTSQACEAALEPALREGLILPAWSLTTPSLGAGSPHYRFLHDRVQQASYALLGESERRPAHLEIGRLLRDAAGGTETRLFEVIHHLNLGRELIESHSERAALADLNLKAARKARASAAFEEVHRLSAVGLELLGKTAWTAQPALTFELTLLLAESAYLTGQHQAADTLFPVLVQNARQESDLGRAYYLQLTLLSQQGRYIEAVAVFRRAMRALGETIPATQWQCALQLPPVLLAIRRQLAGRPISALAELPVMQDPRQLLKAQLMGVSLDILVATGQKALIGLTVARLVRLSLEAGNSEMGVLAYVFYGGVCQQLFGDYAASRQFAELALVLAAKSKNPILQNKIYTGVSMMIGHYYQPLEACIRDLRAGLELIRAEGHLLYASYNLYFILSQGLLAGKPLPEMYEECLNAIELIKSIKQNKILAVLATVLVEPIQVLRGLQAPDFEYGLSRDELLRLFADAPMLQGHYNLARLRNAYLLGETATALGLVPGTLRDLKDSLNLVQGPEGHFYAAMTLLDACRPGAAAKARLKQVRRLYKQLKRWAALCPANYGHKFLLVEAERLAVEGQTEAAEASYAAAAQSAAEHGFHPMNALTH
ncbi:MAG TPA: hypothetical protein V6D23_08045, partial [Candidatus Obscuribacterales bacterium]